MFKKINTPVGFTLIELLVVISIIGVLVALSFAGFTEARKGARDSKRKADLEQIRSVLEIYRNDVKTYPGDFSGCLYTRLEYGNDIYLSEVPKDPLCPNQNYVYHKIDDNTYCLCARLETSSSITGSCNCGSSNCGASGECNYKVSNF